MTERRQLPLKLLVLGAVVLAGAVALFFRMVLFAPQVEVVTVEAGVISVEVKGPGSVSSQVEVNLSSRISGVVQRVLVPGAAPEIADRLVTTFAATKTFNLAGAHVGACVTSNAALKRASLSRRRAALARNSCSVRLRCEMSLTAA